MPRNKQSIVERVTQGFGDVIGEFESRVLPIPFLPRGILTSEAFAVCAAARLLGVSAIIETGVYEGRSSLFWRRWFNPAWSIDNSWRADCTERIKNTHITMIDGYAEHELVPLVASVGNVCVFIDGPKGQSAIDLAQRCLSHRNVAFVAIHDMHRDEVTGDTLNEARLALAATPLWPTWFTDNQQFVDHFAYLDYDYIGRLDEHQNLRWFPGCYRNADGLRVRHLGSYGPTVGFLFHDEWGTDE